jgi:hypothetical protein
MTANLSQNKRTPTPAALVCGALLAGLLAVGCQDTPALFYQSSDGRSLSKPAGDELVADPQSPIPDVPKPVGFLFIESRSNSQSSPTQRRVTHVYEGLATRSQAADYYRKTLLGKGWIASQDTMDASTSVLNFTKANEGLQVRVSESGRFLTVLVQIREQGTLTPPNAP